ncbi:hypothetical protein D3C73_684280 [compost metagenome]
MFVTRMAGQIGNDANVPTIFLDEQHFLPHLLQILFVLLADFLRGEELFVLHDQIERGLGVKNSGLKLHTFCG